MKVFIGKPHGSRHWVSPYTIKEIFFFWKKNYDAFENEPHPLLTAVCEAIRKVLDEIDPDIEYIKIDNHDTWSADHTLAKIIHPLLVRLKATIHGAPCVDDADVPDELKSMNAPRIPVGESTDEFFFARWDYVLDEMIYAFSIIKKFDVSPEQQPRVDNGVRLFGRYYGMLWD